MDLEKMREVSGWTCSGRRELALQEALSTALKQLEKDKVPEGEYETVLSGAGLIRSKTSGRLMLQLTFSVISPHGHHLPVGPKVVQFLALEGRGEVFTHDQLTRFGLACPLYSWERPRDWGQVVNNLMHSKRHCRITLRRKDSFSCVTVEEVHR